MNLHSVALGVALLVSAAAFAQDNPDTLGKASKTAGQEDASQPAAKRRLPQPDNPLDPNRVSKSTREAAKIRPAEQGATPAENTRKVGRTRKSDTDHKKAEPAKIRPAENAVTPTENTDKVDKPEQDGKQASNPASRRAVLMTIDGMPAATPSATYGPRLNAQQGISANAPTNLPTTAIAPSPPLTPPAPAIVNSCGAGGCVDTNGVRYQGGVGSTLLGPQGQPCRQNGPTVQC